MTSRRKSTPKAPQSRIITAVIAVLAIAVISWKAFRATSNNQPSQSTEQSADGSKYNAAELLEVKLPDGTKHKTVQYPGFTVSFNAKHHIPNYVAWQLTGKNTEGSIKRTNKFLTDESVSGCPVDNDYRNSGYDRGHMFPAADAKNREETMDACFYLTNICPQEHSLNNGAWKRLEENCRKWAVRDSAIIIISGPVLADRLTKTIGETPVTVPDRFFKIILAPYANPPRAIGFIMNNGYVPGGMQQAAVSVDQVEAITGMDFFAALPDSIENIVEAQCNFPQWQKTK